MLCSEKNCAPFGATIRLFLRHLGVAICSAMLICSSNVVFAATKKHHKPIITVKHNHVNKQHKRAMPHHKLHHSPTYSKRTAHNEEKNVASDLSIGYHGTTLVAHVAKPAAKRAPKEIATHHADTAIAATSHVVGSAETAEAEPQENNLIQTIAKSMNFSPAKFTSDAVTSTNAAAAEVAAQSVTMPTVKHLSAPGYLSTSSEPASAMEIAEAVPEAAAVAPVEEHTSFAASMEKHLVNFVRKTVATLRYSDYKLGGKKFDTSRGVYVVDCSSFVDHILQRVSPRAYLSLVSATGADSPATQHYYEYFTELGDGDNFWNKVEAVDELRAGDILVFRYKNSRGSETGGHVMVVMDRPTQDADVFFVRVADSAPSRHSQDTRQRNEAGIGIGTLVLKVNPRTGRPAAYAWGLGGLWNKNVNFAMARPLGATDFG